jgi:hypothetical protein
MNHISGFAGADHANTVFIITFLLSLRHRLPAPQRVTEVTYSAVRMSDLPCAEINSGT